MKPRFSYLVCCPNGAGSSLMMKIILEKVLNKNKRRASKIGYATIVDGAALAKEYQVVLCAEAFVPRFAEAKAAGVRVIGLKNIMSAGEIEAQLNANGLIGEGKATEA